MHANAEAILQVFKARGVQTNGLVSWWDFGEAIPWQGGYIRDESIRLALKELVDDGYVRETAAALELTEKGDRYIYR